MLCCWTVNWETQERVIIMCLLLRTLRELWIHEMYIMRQIHFVRKICGNFVVCPEVQNKASCSIDVCFLPDRALFRGPCLYHVVFLIQLYKLFRLYTCYLPFLFLTCYSVWTNYLRKIKRNRNHDGTIERVVSVFVFDFGGGGGGSSGYSA